MNDRIKAIADFLKFILLLLFVTNLVFVGFPYALFVFNRHGQREYNLRAEQFFSNHAVWFLVIWGVINLAAMSLGIWFYVKNRMKRPV